MLGLLDSPARQEWEPPPKPEKRLRAYPILLLDGEMLSGCPGGVEGAIALHEQWARATLARAGLPTGLGLHYRDGDEWVEVPATYPGLMDGLAAEVRRRGLADRWESLPTFRTVFGMISDKASAEYMAAQALLYVDSTRAAIEANDLSKALHSFYMMTLRVRIGLFIDGLEADALAAFRSRMGGRKGGRAPREEIRAKHAEWIACAASLRLRRPDMSKLQIARLVKRKLRATESENTIRRAIDPRRAAE